MSNQTNEPLPVKFSRPGVSDELLSAAGCHHVDEADCARLYGFKAAGIAIPFQTAHGETVTDGEKPFARVRLYHETDTQKYAQRSGSGVHVYIPPGFRDRVKGSTLILVEGEFKACALTEAGYAAIGLCGITGAARNVKAADGETTPQLNDELAEILKWHQPGTVVFAGDADVVLNSHFAIEIAKLRKLICGDRRFSSVKNLLVVKPPVDGPKGFDDCRAEHGENFNQWFDTLLSEGLEVEAKALPDEIFCALLRRERKPLRTMMTGEAINAHRLRVKLLQSATELWNKTGANLALKPLLAEILSVAATKISGLIRDAAENQKRQSDQRNQSTEPDLQGTALTLAEIQPWEQPVSGPELFNEILKMLKGYVALPPGAVVAIPLWCAHTHVFKCFSHTPRLHVTSPEKRCGKTTLRDLIALLVPRAMPAENLTGPVLFRVIEKYQPTLLVDEADAWLRDNEEMRGLLNSGHKQGGAAYRCVGDDHEVRGFKVFGPVALCGIGALPGTLQDRSIPIRLIRAKEGEIEKRFDSLHVEIETRLCRKLARWCQDNRDRIATCAPVMPAGCFNRAADNWRPLFAIAQIIGGDWPALAADAFAKLSGDDADIKGQSETLLEDIQAIFAERKCDRLFSKELIAALTAISDRPWGEANHGKPITENWLARHLRRFSVQSGSIRRGDDTGKGYYREAFCEAFARYTPEDGASRRHSVTSPVNIEQNALVETSQSEPRDVCETGVPTNAGAGCDAVTIEKSNKVYV